ncbi:hypothetical protein CFELI_00470 [Corynebacterium felinum]|uniref:Uncharacterized protein n=1 Tax=Corynebacterium felinum TaxID=131318 RepID=A0ABU2B704_9CORY|nr:hypothetical protein [Corynebacterium felinum]WJY93751.1 hypothetical protein CFELI_00470 [Corynebacterium felinum]
MFASVFPSPRVWAEKAEYWGRGWPFLLRGTAHMLNLLGLFFETKTEKIYIKKYENFSHLKGSLFRVVEMWAPVEKGGITHVCRENYERKSLMFYLVNLNGFINKRESC